MARHKNADDKGFVSEPVLRTLVCLSVRLQLEKAAVSGTDDSVRKWLTNLLPGASNEVPRIIAAIREEYSRLQTEATVKYLQWSSEAQRFPNLSYARSRARAANESVVPHAVLPPPGFVQPKEKRLRKRA